MFDVGFAEIFLLALIGLLVLGPERLPGVARTVGGFVRKARSSWISLRNTIESELAEADLSAPIKKTSEELKQIGKNLADMPGLSTGIDPSAKADPGSASIEMTEADPVQDSDSEKNEDV
jgi:sec-independent protein translocase protein TatB